MKLESFFGKFDQFADAPGAMAMMRELILESAIRGKLVPQKASDEPASELLKRIASVQGGQIRKQAVLPPVGDDAYLQIPAGWEWTRLGNTGRIFNGDSVSESGKAELAKVEDGLPFIATKDVGYGRTALKYDNGLKAPLGDPRFKVARANAVLICAEGGSAGRKIGVTDRDICFGNKLYANEVWAGIHHRYVFYVYQAPTFFKEFAVRMTGIIGGIARSEFLLLPFPLPPLAEQRRIVAKVDELMALCDRLEAQQQERETRHSALARASLARFADAPTPANLPVLFHPSYAIPPADLRKCILTLAVQGKLVPQDPNDEPAEELIARLANELTPEQRRKQAAPLAPLPAETLQFELPESWKWARFRDAAIIASNLVKPDDFGDLTHLAPDNIEKGNGVLLPCRTVREDKVISSNHRFYPGQIVYSKIRPNLAKVVVVDFQGLCSADMYPIDALIDPFYLQRYMLSESFLVQAVKTDTRVAMPKINQMELNAIAVPIPPLAEQRRIVAKVEQLMALVDALETQLAASRVTAANLLSALVVELTTQNGGGDET